MEEETHEEVSVEEAVEDNDSMINALIDLLIQKGVISQEEFDNKVDSYYEEEEE